MSESSLRVYTTKYLFKKVKDVVAELVSENPHIKRVLDVPAGAGAFSQFFKEELKLEVEASDIDQDKWKYSKVNFTAADLGRKLPYPDNHFDLVVCVEGLKHITDVSTGIKEMNRVLKGDGFLLITIPNDLCMQSRLRYLTDGFVDTDWIEPMDPNSENEKSYIHLSSLLSLPYLWYFLKKNRIKVIKTTHDRLRFWSLLFGFILFPFIYIGTSKSCKKDLQLKREMLSLTWLAGRRNLVLCKKY
jgi:ubiquinone/menaquinone biosynthesis C-methylase UbiE